MAHQALKRQFEDLNPNNDNLNDDECDVTWGGKRSRYIYNYTLQPDLFSSTNDSDETESVYSIQSKSTVEIVSESDLPSESSCGSDCDCDNIREEFDVLSSSSSNNIHSTTSDSSTTLDYEVTKNDNIICDKTDLECDGYNADDTDVQVTTPKTNLPPPACFKNCLQCFKENPNPYFQYCYTCFRGRMEYFENKPNPKQKKAKRSNSSDCPTEGSPKHSQESNLSNSDSIGISNIHLSQKQTDNSNEKNIDSHTSKILGDIENICNICFTLPKNGVFNHGKTGHIYCCYQCAKKLWKKTNKCPICNVRVKFVTKMIVV